MEEDWRRIGVDWSGIGGGLEEDRMRIGVEWRRIEGGLEEDWRRIGVDWKKIGGGSKEDWGGIFMDFRWSDGCRWIVFGLVTPQDGLLTPPSWGLRADLFKKRPKSLKSASFLRFFHQGAQIGCRSQKTGFYFFCYLPHYIGVSGSLIPCKR